jgi:hypothetical protein
MGSTSRVVPVCSISDTAHAKDGQKDKVCVTCHHQSHHNTLHRVSICIYTYTQTCCTKFTNFVHIQYRVHNLTRHYTVFEVYMYMCVHVLYYSLLHATLLVHCSVYVDHEYIVRA